jgi:hypothetical protein
MVHVVDIILGYSLARSLYEDNPDKPLSDKVLQNTICAAAYNAVDNASNPNRTRGGLKKCDDMYAFASFLSSH